MISVLPESAAHVLHLELEVADARHAAQRVAAVVGDVEPVVQATKCNWLRMGYSLRISWHKTQTK